MSSITPKEFELLSGFILENAGIQLDQGKEYLVEARLSPLLQKEGLDTYNDLYRKVISDRSGDLKTKVIDAITINETYFFRDNAPFELLKNKIFPDLIDLRTKQYSDSRIPIKIWSAACSTGQEVYSIGMTLSELIPDLDKFDINILGTDISHEAVSKASYGKYGQFEVERGLGPFHLSKYFTSVPGGYRIKDRIRSLARFNHFDLNQSFTSLGLFDIVFCRNVAIYFPMDRKRKLFSKIATSLNSGGSLIVGGSESLAGIATDFIPRHYLNSVYYQKVKDKQSVFSEKEEKTSIQAPRPTKTYKSLTDSKPVSPSTSRSDSTNRRIGAFKVKEKVKARKKPDFQKSLKKKVEIAAKTHEPKDLKIDSKLTGSAQEKASKTSLLAKIGKRASSEKASITQTGKSNNKIKDSLLDLLKEKEKDQNEKS